MQAHRCIAFLFAAISSGGLLQRLLQIQPGSSYNHHIPDIVDEFMNPSPCTERGNRNGHLDSNCSFANSIVPDIANGQDRTTTDSIRTEQK